MRGGVKRWTLYWHTTQCGAFRAYLDDYSNYTEEILLSSSYRYETMAWFSPFIYAPFYCFAVYAFIYEKEWIRVPCT